MSRRMLVAAGSFTERMSLMRRRRRHRLWLRWLGAVAWVGVGALGVLAVGSILTMR